MISINGVRIRPTEFPDKTSQVWKLPDDLLESLYKEGMCTVRWVFESEAEFMHLAQLKTLLDTRCQYITLDMPYLPYARQDKWVDNKTTFALRTFANLLNSLNFTEVHVLDAHNNLRANAILNLVDESPKKHIEAAFKRSGAGLILFPDAGAQLRYDAYKVGPSIYANKKRDQLSGKIIEVTFEGSVVGRKVLIVDDICDGGMTFKLIAEAALKPEKNGQGGALEVHLYVTHGIFSQGLKTLRDSGIKRIWSSNKESSTHLTEHLMDPVAMV
jgi:ribose-phosphate pyrophosphokinase